MSIQDFALSYQKSPIVFNGGIAANVPGGLLPLVSVTQAQDYEGGILAGSSAVNLSSYRFEFMPAAGATLAEFQLGAYPFANQAIAANAVIAQPLRISLVMLAPARGAGAYDDKLATFQALQSALNQHALLGGTYTVATPSYLYANCILLALRDISAGDPKRPQDTWQWDFIQPLLTLAEAQQAQNSMMQKVSNGTILKPGPDGSISYSGQGPSVGNPASGTGPSTVPAATPLPGASVGSRPSGVGVPGP